MSVKGSAGMSLKTESTYGLVVSTVHQRTAAREGLGLTMLAVFMPCLCEGLVRLCPAERQGAWGRRCSLRDRWIGVRASADWGVFHERPHSHCVLCRLFAGHIRPRACVRVVAAVGDDGGDGRAARGGWAMTAQMVVYVCAAVVAAGLLIYLLVALLKPEWFQ